MDKEINYFFAKFTERTRLKKVKGRNYGHIRFVPDSAIVVYVKKKSVSISFDTEGNENALSSIEHARWAHENMDDFAGFELKDGEKNKRKSILIREFPFAQAEDLTEDAFINDCFQAVQLLTDKIKLIASPKDCETENSFDGAYSSFEEKSTDNNVYENCCDVSTDEQDTYSYDELDDSDFDSIYDSKLYLLKVQYADGEDLEKDQLIDDCVALAVNQGFLLAEHVKDLNEIYLVAKNNSQKFALKIDISVGKEKREVSESVVTFIKNNHQNDDIYDENDLDISILFFASETDDQDLWSWCFNRFAQDSEKPITIIGYHSVYNNYAIQQWDEGDYDEGVESNPNEAEEFYVDLEKGLSLKCYKYEPKDFDLNSYVILDN